MATCIIITVCTWCHAVSSCCCMHSLRVDSFGWESWIDSFGTEEENHSAAHWEPLRWEELIHQLVCNVLCGAWPMGIAGILPLGLKCDVHVRITKRISLLIIQAVYSWSSSCNKISFRYTYGNKSWLVRVRVRVCVCVCIPSVTAWKARLL